MPVPCRPPVKKAVLVGVEYSTNENLMRNDLRSQPGAHHDTERLRELLTGTYGYKNEDIVILIDNEEDESKESWPTRENILSAMKRLVAGTQAGDHIVFSFSGHGSQLDAVEDKDEIDGKDEVILPIDASYAQDSCPDSLTNFIRDDDIRRILVNELPDGVRCTMVFDCCHSGTASDLPVLSPTSPTSSVGGRKMWDFEERFVVARSGGYAQMTTVHDESPHPVQCLGPSTRENVYPPSRRGGLPAEKETHVISLSACLDDQITYGKRSGGIFIKALTNVLRANPRPTHRDLLHSLRKELETVTIKANKQLSKGSSVDPTDLYVSPRPQLGSLKPEGVLHAEFTF